MAAALGTSAGRAFRFRWRAECSSLAGVPLLVPVPYGASGRPWDPPGERPQAPRHLPGLSGDALRASAGLRLSLG